MGGLHRILLSFIFLLVSAGRLLSYSMTEGNFFNTTYLESNKLMCLSCKGRCGEINDGSSELIHCSCDDACLLFGDCCLDYPALCPKNTKAVEPKPHQIRCISSRSNSEYEEQVSAIASCPYSNFACSVTKGDINTEIPALDNQTGFHYVTVMCASCNGVVAVVPWNATYTLSEESKPSLTGQSTLNDFQGKILISYRPPISQWTSRYCKDINVVDNCDTSYRNNFTDMMCHEAPFGYLQVGYQTYKNVFCALCNHVEGDNLTCRYSTKTTASSQLPVSKPEGDVQKERRIIPVFYSWRLYFGINRELMIDRICLSGEIFIPSEKTCYKVFTGNLNSTSNIDITLTLVHSQENTVPFTLLSVMTQVVAILTSNTMYSNFTPEAFERIWEKRYDLIRIKGKRTAEPTIRDLSTDRHLIPKLLNKFHFGYSEVDVQLLLAPKTLEKTCKLLEYSKWNITVDSLGTVVLSQGTKFQPGEYIILNNTVLVCQKKITQYNEYLISLICLISMILSVLCILIHLTMICFFKPDNHWRTTGLAFCLLFTNSIFLINPLLTEAHETCVLTGILLHFGFLSCFAWMNLMAIDLWLTLSVASTLRKTHTSTKGSRWKYILPFIFPILLVVACIITDQFTDVREWKALYGSDIFCGIHGFFARIAFFLIPGGLSLLITFTFTVLSGYRLYVLWKMTNNITAKQKNYFVMFLKLAVMNGVYWCVGFIAIPTNNITMFVIFVLLAATQGVWLLLVVWGGKCKGIVQTLSRSNSGSNVRTVVQETSSLATRRNYVP